MTGETESSWTEDTQLTQKGSKPDNNSYGALLITELHYCNWLEHILCSMELIT